MSGTVTFPACGLYRTTAPIGSIPAGRLVLFHNHGDPGPGVYLPEGWTGNRARFSRSGTTLSDLALAQTMKALPAEGLYVVEAPFTCCEKLCRTFDKDTLLQLGYDGAGRAILFTPAFAATGLSFPERGQGVEDDRLGKLRFLKVASPPSESAPSVGGGGFSVPPSQYH